jgi:hypothetical protein
MILFAERFSSLISLPGIVTGFTVKGYRPGSHERYRDFSPILLDDPVMRDGLADHWNRISPLEVPLPLSALDANSAERSDAPAPEACP